MCYIIYTEHRILLLKCVCNYILVPFTVLVNIKCGGGNILIYPNLISEIAKRNIKRKKISEALNISYKAFSNKLNGIAPFTFSEALKINEMFFPDVDIKTLFKRL